MKVASVFRRPQRNLPPEEWGEIRLVAGVGIDGDCHASPVSPRQLLIVSTGAYDYCNLPPRSLRENILVEVANLNLSSGTVLRLGPEAAVRITFECEPCGRLNKFRPGLSKDVRGKRGYLGRVVRSGVVKPGFRIKVDEGVFEPFSDNWKDRLISVVNTLPADIVVSYSQLAELAGVPKVFCRAFPRVLRAHGDLPWQRVVRSNQLGLSGLQIEHKPHLVGAIFGNENLSFVKE